MAEPLSPALAASAENPFLRLVGAKLVEWSREHAVVALVIRPEHLNRSGVVHGGVYTVLIDAAGGLAGCYPDDPQEPVRSFTLSLTTSFLDAADRGTLYARGSLRRRGSRVYFSSIEITTGAGKLAAIGEGSFLYHSRGAQAAVPQCEDRSR